MHFPCFKNPKYGQIQIYRKNPVKNKNIPGALKYLSAPFPLYSSIYQNIWTVRSIFSSTYQKIWIVRSIYGSTFPKIIEKLKIQNFVEKSKIFKWPYLQFPCVKNPNSGKNPDISKIEQKSKKLAEGHQVFGAPKKRVTFQNEVPGGVHLTTRH